MFVCITYPTNLDLNNQKAGITVTNTNKTYLFYISYFILKWQDGL